MALLVIEHDFGFLERFADRLVCLDQGRVVADGMPAAVRVEARPAGGGSDRREAVGIVRGQVPGAVPAGVRAVPGRRWRRAPPNRPRVPWRGAPDCPDR